MRNTKEYVLTRQAVCYGQGEWRTVFTDDQGHFFIRRKGEYMCINGLPKLMEQIYYLVGKEEK